MFTDFISLIYPQICPGCENTLVKGEHIICTGCHVKLPETNHHLEPENGLAKRFHGRINLQAAFACLHFVKGGIVQNLLHSLKYHSREDVGFLLGKMYGHILKKELNQPVDLVLPVPLHKNKLRKRGFNQCDCIAEGMAEGLQTNWSDKVLIRDIENPTQTKKNRIERWDNVERIFSIADPKTIEGKHILLIDDVVTTGSTLEACGQVIMECECESLSISTLASAVK